MNPILVDGDRVCCFGSVVKLRSHWLHLIIKVRSLPEPIVIPIYTDDQVASVVEELHLNSGSYQLVKQKIPDVTPLLSLFGEGGRVPFASFNTPIVPFSKVAEGTNREVPMFLFGTEIVVSRDKYNVIRISRGEPAKLVAAFETKQMADIYLNNSKKSFPGAMFSIQPPF